MIANGSRLLLSYAAVLVLALGTAANAAGPDEMVGDIERLGRQLDSAAGREAITAKVLAAMKAVPRHEFVPEDVRGSAYRNRPLPIGRGQTISQPFIVALMTGLLRLEPGAKVLEIGTGSGYQAAVLSKLAGKVYSIEIIAELGQRAAETLSRLGYSNVEVGIGDGYLGWPEEAPFDAIIVTAAPDHVPPDLVAQLKPGGRMVLPVGEDEQSLLLISKRPDGSQTSEEIVPVRFVPLTRDVR